MERLLATAGDDEPWSFLFRTDGTVRFLFCPWSSVEDEDFDGNIDGLDLPWSPERVQAIDGGADPTEEELEQWRRAVAYQLADGSDWSAAVSIVPLWVDGAISGYAAFVCESSDPDETPALEGIFASVQEATDALARRGAILDRRNARGAAARER
jgi:hypothetical protein